MENKLINKTQRFSPYDIDGMRISEIIKYFQDIEKSYLDAGWDSPMLDISLGWGVDNDSEFTAYRVETAAERNNRLAQEEKMRQQFLKEEEEAERKTLERLKKKYENPADNKAERKE